MTEMYGKISPQALRKQKEEEYGFILKEAQSDEGEENFSSQVKDKSFSWDECSILL